jgi:hypothetical protein
MQEPDDAAGSKECDDELHQQQSRKGRARKSGHAPHCQRLPSDLCFFDRFVHTRPLAASQRLSPRRTALASRFGALRRPFRARALEWSAALRALAAGLAVV